MADNFNLFEEFDYSLTKHKSLEDLAKNADRYKRKQKRIGIIYAVTAASMLAYNTFLGDEYGRIPTELGMLSSGIFTGLYLANSTLERSAKKSYERRLIEKNEENEVERK